MKKTISVEINSIRDINNFYFLNRRYSSMVEISTDSGNLYGCSDYSSKPVLVTAEGSENKLDELEGAYRLFGIAS